MDSMGIKDKCRIVFIRLSDLFTICSELTTAARSIVGRIILIINHLDYTGTTLANQRIAPRTKTTTRV